MESWAVPEVIYFLLLEEIIGDPNLLDKSAVFSTLILFHACNFVFDCSHSRILGLKSAFVSPSFIIFFIFSIEGSIYGGD